MDIILGNGKSSKKILFFLSQKVNIKKLKMSKNSQFSCMFWCYWVTKSAPPGDRCQNLKSKTHHVKKEKIRNMIFWKWGGVKGSLKLFRKFIHFCRVTLPLVIIISICSLPDTSYRVYPIILPFYCLIDQLRLFNTF